MNLNRQPGINVDSIILSNLSMTRAQEELSNFKIRVDIQSESGFLEEDDNKAMSKMEFTLIGEEENGDEKFVVIANYDCFFSINEEPNLDLKEYVEKHAPAMVLSYFRELVTNLSVKASLPPIIIPPINVMALNEDTTEQN
jgi:preprotein translocase subunit SecB